MPPIKIKRSELTDLENDLLWTIEVALATDYPLCMIAALMLGKTRALLNESRRRELAKAEPFGLLSGDEILAILHPNDHRRPTKSKTRLRA